MSLSDDFANWCDGVVEALRAADMVDACAASGDVTEAVEDMVRHPAMSAMVRQVHESEALARRLAYDLSECGACDDEELGDVDANIARKVWLIACDMREGERS